MQRATNPRRSLATALALLAALWLVSGCEHTVPTEEGPDAQMAASLSLSASSAASVDRNLDLAGMLDNPMELAATESGLYGDADFDDWTGDGVTLPQLGLLASQSFVRAGALGEGAAALSRDKDRRLEELRFATPREAFDYAPGDTIAVEYFDAPDSTGLNALLFVEAPGLARFVSLRQYPDGVGPTVIRRDSEVLIDTQGTFDDGADDEIHSLHLEEEMDNGQESTGTIAPESGGGPIAPGVIVLGVLRVDDPMWHPLQAWVETRLRADLNGLDTDADDVIYAMANTVHFRNGSEHQADVRHQDGVSPIVEGATVAMTAAFIASPDNGWLESASDTLTVQIGAFDTDEDDLFVELNRSVVFDGTAIDGGSPREALHLLPEEPVAGGDEPCGGLFEQELYYPAQWWVVHVVREADIACAGGGTLYELVEFKDGSYYEHTITWDAAGNAIVDETHPDGTTVAGSWTEATGEYAITTTFPAGNDPAQREQWGSIQEGQVEAWEVLSWADEHADSTHFTAVGDDDDWTITGFKVNGDLREDFSLHSADARLLEGAWSRNDGARGGFTLEQLEGGSARLVFDAEDPAAPGSPSVEGDVFFAPDGSGHGTIVVTQWGVTVTYEITFGPDGTVTLKDESGHPVPLG